MLPSSRPTALALSASLFIVEASGSNVNVRPAHDALMVSRFMAWPVALAMPALTTSWAAAGLALTQSVAAMWPLSRFSTTSGWALRNVRLTMSCVVTN